jgi:hypothetical protein
MARGKLGLFPSAALLGVFAAFIGLNPAVAQTKSGGPVGGTDDLAPGPIANLSTVIDLVGPSVSLEWELAVDDFSRQSPAGGDFSSGGVFISVNDVAGYEIWRSQLGGEFEILDTASAGQTSYVDTSVTSGITYVYQLVAVDAAGNSSAGIQSEVISLGPPPKSRRNNPPGSTISKRARMIFDGTPPTPEERQQFVDNLIALLSRLLGVDPSRIHINSIVAGSIIVSFDIAPSTDGPTVQEAVTELKRLVAEEPEAFVSVGPVLGLSESDAGDLNFGTVAPDAVVTETFSFDNISDSTNAVLSVRVEITGAGFSVDPASLVLAQNESGEIAVSFDAGVVNNINGSYAGTLVIVTNDPDSPRSEYTLEAAITAGVDRQGISGVPATLKFNKVGTSQSRTRKFTITNTGDLDLTGTVGVDGDAEFTVSSASFIIPGRASFDISVIFSPIGDQLFSANIVVDSNDPNNPQLVIAATGEGVSGIVQLQDADGNQIFGDLNGDTAVNFDDFFIFADNFGAADFDPAADFDEDEDVDFDDFFIFADNFGKSGTYVTLGQVAGQ